MVEGDGAVGLEDQQLHIQTLQHRQIRVKGGRRRQRAGETIGEQGGEQQFRLACVGRRHRLGHPLPGPRHAGRVGRDQGHRAGGGGQCRNGPQRRGRGPARQYPDQSAHQPVKTPQGQHDTAGDEELLPPGQRLANHRQEARHLRDIPIEVDLPSEEDGRGDREVTPDHQEGADDSQAGDQPLGDRPERPDRHQQHQPQGQELRRQAQPGPNRRRPRPVLEPERRVQQEQRGDGRQPFPKGHAEHPGVSPARPCHPA